MVDPVELRRSLGLKPRRPAAEAVVAPSSPSVSVEKTEKKKAAPEALVETDPFKKPVGKLPQDAQRLLRNFYVMRPDIDLPPFVHELDGTHGRFFGDGKDGREIVTGWQPAFVLFVCPLYPETPPQWVKKKGHGALGELVDPGLHEQPEVTPRGFKVGKGANRQNEGTVYIAWKSDGKAPAAPPPKPEEKESPRDARRRVQQEKRELALAERRARAAARKR